MSGLIGYLHGMLDGLLGKNSNDATYLEEHRKLLVIEEMDIKDMDTHNASLAYCTSAGELTGLNL